MNSLVDPFRGPNRFGRVLAGAAALAALSLLGPPVLAGANDCAPKHQPRFSAIYVFGDSLSDTGRAAGVLDPASIPDTDWVNGRECNGPLWIEYLSPWLGLPYEPLNNFAWCGATSGRENTNDPALPGLLDELGEYLAGLPAAGADPDALYVVFAGSNDFLAILRGEKDPVVALPEAIGNIVTTVATLQACGAQHVVVIGVPDISLTPRVRVFGPDGMAVVHDMCVRFEAGLLATFEQYAVDIAYVSTVDLLNEIVAHPCLYGFRNVTEPSLPDFCAAQRAMFWSEIHPTSLAHAWIARAVLDALDVKPVHRPCHLPLRFCWPHRLAWGVLR